MEQPLRVAAAAPPGLWKEKSPIAPFSIKLYYIASSPVFPQ